MTSSPSSSFVWIKYMAFHISLGDMDKARAVAERAIQTINYRLDHALRLLSLQEDAVGVAP